jgi:hypothetical protein
LVRPVREQLEHDRVIRLLQVKLKRKHEVIANIGEDQSTSVKIGQLQVYPDLVLTTADKGRKLMGTVEVETSESVNHLEARSQWAHLGRARAPFYLYVPAGSVDIARRLATENHVHVSELWSFHTIGDQTHFRMVHRTPDDTRRSSEPRGIVTSNKPEVPVTSPLKPIVSMSPVVIPVKAPLTVAAKPAAVVVKSPAAPVMPKNQAALAAKAPKKAIVPARTASVVAAKKKPAPVRKVAVAAARSAPARKAAPARPVKKRK